MSTLAYALLGLLAAQPLSGYDLSQRMKRPVGFFWQARHSQIYPELARLEAQGMVTFQVIEQQDRPDKKVYTITEEGLKALRKWVTQLPEVTPMRDELILKAFNLWLIAPNQAIALFREEERRHREQLAAYEKALQEGAEKLTPEQRTKHSPVFGSYLTLHWGIRYEREYAEWCHWVIQQLEQPEETIEP